MSSRAQDGRLIDALVMGGGPAGSTIAFLLARRGWQVGLVERSAFPRRKVCGEFVSGTNLRLFEALGLRSQFETAAGPAVRRVAVFHGNTVVTAPLPSVSGATKGRALGREHLDSLLLDRARAAGVGVWQPWTVTNFSRSGGHHVCHVRSSRDGAIEKIQARVLIAAHGSWNPAQLPTQPPRRQERPDDLLAFKAHFLNANLDSDLMPLLSFNGGYGGMVRTDGGRTSLSLCIRRARLERCRAAHPGQSAAAAVCSYIRSSCSAVADVLATAELSGEWLATGPIHPQIRSCGQDGVFLVGNASGEAHPVIAEGISMAMQSAWLLDRVLPPEPGGLDQPEALRAAHEQYAQLWRQQFLGRIRVSSWIAHWAMHPLAAALSMPLLRAFPRVLTLGAQASGKAKLLSALPIGQDAMAARV